MDGFGNCPAGFWHGRNGTSKLPTDSVAASVSLALHDALMAHHNLCAAYHRAGQTLTDDTCRAQLEQTVTQRLRLKGLDPADAAASARLALCKPGLDRLAVQIRDEMHMWAVDPVTGDLLAWAEKWLDHGPNVRAVQLKDGYLASTRPDIIGIRFNDDGLYRVIVRDYKARSRPTDPSADTGILVRAFWAYSELQNPRSDWFVKNRNLNLDRDSVILETVNLMHAGGPEFVSTIRITGPELEVHRDRFMGIMDDMEATLSQVDASLVLATPNGLCAEYCPFLHACPVGQMHVEGRKGATFLKTRLAQAS